MKVLSVTLWLGVAPLGAGAEDVDVYVKQLSAAVASHKDVTDAFRFRPMIAPGEANEARDYYKRIGDASELGFDFLNSNFDQLLVYLGYAEEQGGAFKGLLARDLETIDSFVLMPTSASEFEELEDTINAADPGRNGLDGVLNPADFLKDRVLVSRFFAPKITTYYYTDDPATPEREDNQPILRDDIHAINGAGWRKLVRLKARSGSGAANAGLEHAYLLFNFKSRDAAVDPYAGNESGNNQVILVPEDQDSKDSTYFAVYEAKSKGYPIGLALAADFDLPEQNPELGRYYVPRACAECHGHSTSFFADDMKGEPVDASGQITTDFETGRYRFAKPNYLDTDQWYDWMDFDYRDAASSLNDVVFDGGRDHSSAAYGRAFDVISKVNRDIAIETLNAERDPSTVSYQTLAARKWLTLHNNDVHRKPYSMRSIGAESWDADSSDEMQLLRLLNNHCFRCHSSLRYNVFDKASFRETDASGLSRKDYAKLFLERANASGVGYIMPQGRVLETQERLKFVRLLDKVFP